MHDTDTILWVQTQWPSSHTETMHTTWGQPETQAHVPEVTDVEAAAAARIAHVRCAGLSSLWWAQILGIGLVCEVLLTGAATRVSLHTRGCVHPVPVVVVPIGGQGRASSERSLAWRRSPHVGQLRTIMGRVPNEYYATRSPPERKRPRPRVLEEESV